jgi:hypothetical protein
MTALDRALTAFGLLSALSSTALAGPCTDRISQIEQVVAGNAAAGSPSATGTLPQTASGATAGNQSGSTNAGNRLPANRPATPEVAAAEVQSKTADGSAAGSSSAGANRLPANRPPSPTGQAAAVQERLSSPSTGASHGSDTTMALLNDAKDLDRAGREADCMQTLSRIELPAAAGKQ